MPTHWLASCLARRQVRRLRPYTAAFFVTLCVQPCADFSAAEMLFTDSHLRRRCGGI